MRPTTHLRRLALLIPALLAVVLAPVAATAGPATAPDRTPVTDRSPATGEAGPQDRVLAQLQRSARISGTAWGVDPATGQVVVSIDPTVTGVGLATITGIVTAAGDAARIEHLPDELRLTIAGGEWISNNNGGNCSLGFNAHSGTTWYFITAGHCAYGASTWYVGGTSTVIGSTAGASFPGDDFVAVRYTNPAVTHPSAVYLYPGLQDITSVGTPYVGQFVKRSGRTTGVRSGYVTALNATVNYAEGTVYGLIKTNVCAEPGDSGGPLFGGTVGYGILSGGSGNCASGGTSYFQPIKEALSRFGLTVP